MKLICPVCGKPLHNHEKSAVCPDRHTFDYSAGGYLNLALNKSDLHGDSKEMTAARTAFLNTGAYGPLRDEIVRIMEECAPETTVDLCCGEGSYTACLPGTEKYGIDLSKPALKYASRRDRGTLYILASAFRVPLEDHCADCILTCFAPVAEEEIKRLLRPGGTFIYVTGGPDHLFELKSLLYEHPYRNEETDPVRMLRIMDTIELTYPFRADHDALLNLFAMTPYAYRTGNEGKQRIAAADHLDITAQFTIRIYKAV